MVIKNLLNAMGVAAVMMSTILSFVGFILGIIYLSDSHPFYCACLAIVGLFGIITAAIYYADNF